MPTRQILWNVDAAILIYLLLLPTAAIFAYGVYRRWRLWRLGQPAQVERRLGYRLRVLFVDALLQRRLLVHPITGVMHVAIYGGFLVLFLGTCLVFLHNDLGLPILYGWFYLLFKVALNIFGLLLIVGVLVAIWLRYIRRLPRLERPARHNRYDNGVVLTLLLANALAGFALQGLRIAILPEPRVGVRRCLGCRRTLGRTVAIHHTAYRPWHPLVSAPGPRVRPHRLHPLFEALPHLYVANQRFPALHDTGGRPARDRHRTGSVLGRQPSRPVHTEGS